MFTGIIEQLGEIVAVADRGEDRELTVSCPALAARLEPGHSIAIDGCCQTVTARGDGRFAVHAIAETLRVTTLGSLAVGDRVHLEPALPAGHPLGGHIVQGHVDGTAELVSREAVGESERFTFATAPGHVSQMVPKGSVALGGMSLTLGPALGEDRFEVFLIPHTLEVSTWARLAPGDRVNLETDILGKYAQRMLAPYLPQRPGGPAGETA